MSESPKLKIAFSRGVNVVPVVGPFGQIRNQIYWIDNLIPNLIYIIRSPVNDIKERGDTVVGIVSGLRAWTNRGSNPGTGKGFIVYSKRLDRLWGSFPRDKAAGA
jgi:hypothetical protein